MYKLTKGDSIIRLADGANIPKDLMNADYADYVEWAKTNTALPIDIPPFADAQLAFTFKIDEDIDAIYAKVVGNRFAEYQDAALEAKAFKDTLYLGTAGASVSAWATVKAKTNTWAADDILATAAAWKGAQAQMRNVRLTHKEQARNAVTYTQLKAIQASWQTTLTAIKTLLGIV